jgi:NAD(P)-dependent dehydrogenase (short-subunit alcohol dehydrogenase family)
MQLQDKTAIVTGGAVRLGRAISLALARHGANIVIHYAHSQERAAETLAELEDLGASGIMVQAEFGQPAEVSRVVESAVAAFGQADILINNAAIFEPGDFMATDEAAWDRHFHVNLKAPFLLSQAFAAQVPSDRHGKIVNISDTRGLRPGTDHFAYTLTKASLITLTEIMAQALAPNITVNALALGAILPPADRIASGHDDDHMDRLAAQLPLKRTGGPADVVAGVLLLIEGSDFITGITVPIDGGDHL